MDFTVAGTPAMGGVIPGNKFPAVSMSYHGDGKRLFVASEGDSRLQIIDCANGKAEQVPLKCEREKIHLVQATHHDHSVLLAGKGSPTQPLGQRYAINYLSVFDNKIMRKFKGHSDAVTSISMCPADDTFLSSSRDKTVRLWDVKEAGCLAELKLPDSTVGEPLAVFDSTGLVFAVTAAMSERQGHYVHLYDARNYNGGAFAELRVSQTDLENAIQSQVSTTPVRAAEMSRGDWKSIEFNLSGNQILIGADQGVSVLLDGFEGTIQRVLVPPGANYSSSPAVSCFTPDDKTVLAGHDDGTITCWDVDSGAIVNTLKGHTGRVNCLAANPKYAQIASSCTNTALWIW